MDTILFLNSCTATESHRQKIAGVNRYARMRKWNVQPVEAGPDSAEVIAYYRKALKPIGAIIETRMPLAYPVPNLGPLPTVYLDTDPGEKSSGRRLIVHGNQAEIAHMAFCEFKTMRFTSVAYAGWFKPIFWSEARKAAFAADAALAGMKCSIFAPETRQIDRIYYDDALCRWLDVLPSATGVFAANDEIASHVLSCCRRLGLSVPAEIAVLGVDNDVSRCENETPTLSSIQLDFENAGYKACELLDRKVSCSPIPSPAIVFGPLGVLRRESTRVFQRGNPKLMAALALIRAKACEGLRAREVAAVIGGSRRLAEMRFREAFGKSILEEIQNIRFERVRFLLANTTKPIGAIADFCGYKSPETLRRLFSRREGMTMSEYRERNAAGNLRI